ncbi:MAG: hypothetical protein LUG91_06220 [Ruminococcus sp.]|nr:hypothetical protein [Ruminococcus sp.]
MDNFAEQLVRREPTSSDKTKKILIYGGGILLTVILIVVAFILGFGSLLSMLSVILAVGAGYGTYFLGQSTYVEYEYTFTNGDLDIDKIVAKKKRSSLISANVRSFTAFGKYNENLEETSDMTVVLSSDNIASHEYYADFEDEEYGSVRLIFSPDEKMLENIKRVLPRTLRYSL